jgi:hypothetical protein
LQTETLHEDAVIYYTIFPTCRPSEGSENGIAPLNPRISLGMAGTSKIESVNKEKSSSNDGMDDSIQSNVTDTQKEGNSDEGKRSGKHHSACQGH